MRVHHPRETVAPSPPPIVEDRGGSSTREKARDLRECQVDCPLIWGTKSDSGNNEAHCNGIYVVSVTNDPTTVRKRCVYKKGSS